MLLCIMTKRPSSDSCFAVPNLKYFKFSIFILNSSRHDSLWSKKLLIIKRLEDKRGKARVYNFQIYSKRLFALIYSHLFHRKEKSILRYIKI